MGLELDSATWAEVNAVTSASARANAVLAALANPVSFRVYNGAGTVMGSGTLATPWGVASGGNIAVAALASFAVSVAGTPDSTWRARFESGARWLRGTFGLTGSGADFIWSGSTWTVGQPGRMAGVTIICQESTLAFGWVSEATKSIAFQTGGSYDVTQDAVVPNGMTATYAIVPPVTGFSINPSTGALTSSVASADEPVTVEMWDGQADFGWINEAEVKHVNVTTGGAGYSVAQDALVPNGVTATYAIVPAVTGMAINPATGLMTSSIDRTATSVAVEIWDGQADGALEGSAVASGAASGALGVSPDPKPLAGSARASATASGNISGGSAAYVTDPDQVIAAQTTPRPAQNAPYVLGTYGTTLVRVTDSEALGMPGAGPGYAQQQAWNSDETLLLLYDASPIQNVGGFPYIFDATPPYARRTPKYGVNTPWPASPMSGTWKWSPKLSEPRSLYVFANDAASAAVNWNGFTPHAGAVLIRQTLAADFLTSTHTVVASWPGYAKATKDPSSEEARLSPLGQIWVAGVLEVANGGPYFAFTHNVDTNATALLDLLPSGVGRVPDYCAMTPLCDGVVLTWASDTEGAFTRWTGKELFDLSWNFIKQIEPTSAHADMVLDPSGDQYYVYVRSSNVKYTRAPIFGATQVLTPMGLVAPSTTPVQGGHHVSGRHSSVAKPWVAINQYSDYGLAGWAARQNEVMLLYLDSSDATRHVLRLCQHRSLGLDYSVSMPHATVNRSGTKVLFGSNWGSGTIRDAYIVSIPV
jgi:hypothetical protein